MPRRRRVEDDVIESARDLAAGQELGELVEGGDLGRAGAGELLLHRRDGIGLHDAAHRPDDPVAIRLRRGLGVDVEQEQAGHARHGGRFVLAHLDVEDLPEVRRRIGAHEQHALAGIREVDCDRAGERRLADAALAGEEQVSGDGVGDDHGVSFS